ncbi:MULTISPECIES: spherulation-specific family 4 protein [unclassified Streptomyces]|uniref:spherulation-specific family 4 protein n=1 Tax=unclassified Streptomyces TaxID=2593676 RepID=UPI002E29D26A|nr:spherulation-specific family 4 protein [Streptomyces sp. NBC_00223]
MPRLIPLRIRSRARRADAAREGSSEESCTGSRDTAREGSREPTATSSRTPSRTSARTSSGTPPSARGGADGAARTGFGVPAFAHPLVAPAEWAELARPGAPLDWVAFDVARGPGARPDPLYGEAVARVRENGVPLLGRLDAVHGTRPRGELLAEAARYRDWYRVDGFYLDRPPTLGAETAECRRTVAALRAQLDGAGTVVLAPGAHPHPGYAEFADQLVVFHGPWTRYRWSEAPQWTAGYPPTRFAHLVHGLAAPHLDTALRIARWQGAATVCPTDRTDRDGADPWAGLPSYWHEAVRKVCGQPSPSM